MTSMAVCPRCHTMLNRSENGPQQKCDRCHGTFLPSKIDRVSQSMSVDVTKATPLVSTAPLDVNVSPIPCPQCLTHMRPLNGSVGVFDCPACGSRWSDSDAHRVQAIIAPAAQSTTPIEPASQLSSFTKTLLYGVSLPERLLRSGIGFTAGTAKELAAFIVPQAFQSSKSYEIAIDNSLRFLTETIGGVAGPTPPENQAHEHIARKAVGNFVDMAGLATLHVSPMWMLAAVSDIAYGTRTYVMEVARELEQQGVIDSTSTIHSMDDILDAIQKASGTAATTFDRPPLSIDELRETLNQTRSDLKNADLTKLLPEAEVRRLWTEMRTVATQENVDLLSVSSAITMQTLDNVKTFGDGALTSIRVAGGLFDRNVLSHYKAALDDIRERGFYEMVRNTYEPYVTAVWHNFSAERQTWTETILNPDNISSAVHKMFAYLEGEQGGARS
ncbi:MAG: hypothetical protein R3B91_19335 [Planctomycetaceae bacterium]